MSVCNGVPEPVGSGGALARGRTAVTTRACEGSNQTQRMVMTRRLQCRAGSG